MSISSTPEKMPPPIRTTGALNKRLLRKGIGSHRPLWLLWPGLVLLLVIVGIPFLIAFYISFLNLDQYSLRSWLEAPWVGLSNYLAAFTNGNVVGASLLVSLGVSLGFSLLTTLFIVPIGILAALTVNTPYRGRAFVRILYLIPYVIPTFVTALIWRMMFLNGTGLVDRFLAAIHVANVNTYWLLGANSFWAMVIADTWASWPFIYMLTLAGLQSLPSEVYDSAAVDGANFRQKMLYIVLPHLRHTLALAVLLSTLNHFNNFTLPFVMFGTPPPIQADVLPLNIYVSSFQLFNFGGGAAMSVVTLILVLIPGFLYIRSLRLSEVKAS
ncbi:carbohydrate ABC transporter permease [Ktedonobacter racemifer]|uniref:Binding-protein-dependent transport systems inner membrane component n=1 Tax=Ktedonobacter racemifer DSM 44963 TaxID=485913 RepID=D6TV55_KTERA|nr:sugar ABC transporter permease [Ktedonobacter racemifer]EFH84155.1 binding-protein-dependent transport systems inner membrane component [Ktedonobacter racemifer DSM 44963]